jgi:hypothetical protein
MSPLEHLASLLRPAVHEAAKGVATGSGIDKLLSEMQARAKGKRGEHVAEDQQLQAVRRFWDSQEVKSFRDAYLLAWSLTVPHRPAGACILDDRGRLEKVLDGIDGWQGRPSAYRRCYQGLVKSYFTYDAHEEHAPDATLKNWRLLRDYLAQRNEFIKDERVNPEWVELALSNQQLFGERPCELHVDALLRGDASAIDHLCEQLGINKASWFLRELVLAQVKGATALNNGKFQDLIPRLMPLLAANEVLRDRGMVLVLDRYSQIPGTPLHQGMRDHAVNWWGNPWLPSNETRWGGVKPEARAMVAEWLKLEFIETFFTKLAEDGLGDPRRMNFWKRYVKAINHIEFALGATARNSKERDMVVLRKKMTGLVRTLDTSGANNAFIMHMGPLVAVEFSSVGNAFYGYDARQSVPFDTTKMLRLEVNGRNSLKNKNERILWMSHQDGIHNWDRWEQMFEATLRKSFSLEPGAAAAQARRVAAATPPPAPREETVNMNAWRMAAAPQQFSRSALNLFARENGLTIEDLTSRGGNLWVRSDETDDVVQQVLTRWGFHQKPGKGWWK